MQFHPHTHTHTYTLLLWPYSFTHRAHPSAIRKFCAASLPFSVCVTQSIHKMKLNKIQKQKWKTKKNKREINIFICKAGRALPLWLCHQSRHPQKDRQHQQRQRQQQRQGQQQRQRQHSVPLRKCVCVCVCMLNGCWPMLAWPVLGHSPHSKCSHTHILYSLCLRVCVCVCLILLTKHV